MKDLESIPFHDWYGEELFEINRKESGLFEVRIIEGHFSKHFFYGTNTGEHAKIRANNYPDQDYKRVLMYLAHRCPTWPEMVELANLFFNPGESVIQFHPRLSEYVNRHLTTLHLWEPKDTAQLENLHLATQIIKATTEKLHKSNLKQGVIRGNEHGKRFVAIFCGDEWYTWEQVCSIKQEYFGPYKTAFQLNISKEFDLHPSKILTLWDADEFGIHLPPKDIV